MLIPFAALALAAVAQPADGARRVDALTARVDTEDADRFVAVFEAADGAPSAEALQAGYLDPGSYGIEVFTPHRIVDAENLAAKIAANPDDYRRAIDVCLPIAKQASAELRAVYLALDGLLGDPDLPEIYALFGANNSGGTAGPGAQVLGLEVICRIAETEDELRDLFRHFFAHETVHTLQSQFDEETFAADPLLAHVLQEGGADFVARLVTGRDGKPERVAWAEPREAEIWGWFEEDRRAVAALDGEKLYDRDSPLRNWVANAGSPPEGRPDELGYWLGMRIAEAYFDAAEDKRAALADLLELKDPIAILNASGYAERFAAAE